MNPRFESNDWAVSAFLRWLSMANVVLLLTLSVPPAWTQSASTGTVSGQVMDRQSALIPGAEVVLTDTSTNSAQTTQTNDAGRFIFLNVAPGTYNLSVSKIGFTQAKLLAQTVEVGFVRTLNVTLEVGSTNTTVEVRAAAGAERTRSHFPV